MYWPPTMPLTPVAAASSQTAASTSRRLALLVAQHEPERLGVEPVARQDRDVLAVLDVARRPPAAQVVVVHRRQVVVDQRVGVDQLERGRQREHVGRRGPIAFAVASASTGRIRLPPASRE